MMRTDEERKERPGAGSDRWLWRRCCSIDAPVNEATRFIDLAAFADGLRDADERDRVTAWLADDPDALADIGAARVLEAEDGPSTELERVIARACEILPEAHPTGGRIVVLAQWRRHRFAQGFAQWGSIAAAIALAGWLGFAMGSDTSLALTASRPPSDASFLPDLFDSGPAFLRDLGEGLRT